MRNTELLKKKPTPTLQPLSHKNWKDKRGRVEKSEHKFKSIFIYYQFGI